MMTMTTPATSNAYYYISPSTDPYYNIALEDYLYRQLPSAGHHLYAVGESPLRIYGALSVG